MPAVEGSDYALEQALDPEAMKVLSDLKPDQKRLAALAIVQDKRLFTKYRVTGKSTKAYFALERERLRPLAIALGIRTHYFGPLGTTPIMTVRGEDRAVRYFCLEERVARAHFVDSTRTFAYAGAKATPISFPSEYDMATAARNVKPLIANLSLRNLLYQEFPIGGFLSYGWGHPRVGLPVGWTSDEIGPIAMHRAEDLMSAVLVHPRAPTDTTPSCEKRLFTALLWAAHVIETQRGKTASEALKDLMGQSDASTRSDCWSALWNDQVKLNHPLLPAGTLIREKNGGRTYILEAERSIVLGSTSRRDRPQCTYNLRDPLNNDHWLDIDEHQQVKLQDFTIVGLSEDLLVERAATLLYLALLEQDLVILSPYCFTHSPWFVKALPASFSFGDSPYGHWRTNQEFLIRSVVNMRESLITLAPFLLQMEE